MTGQITAVYSKPRGDWIVDELCECGHPRRHHGSKLNPLPNGFNLRMPNKGNCCIRKKRCACRSFTFAGVLTAAQYVDMFIRPGEFIRFSNN